MKRDLSVLASLLVLTTPIPVLAEHPQPEEINVVGVQSTGSAILNISAADLPVLDSAKLLKKIPGANVNSNGPVTGIVQYRGLYGDRVSVVLDHGPAPSGGPNAMGSPLTYTPPMLLKSIAVHRGIAPVSAAQESLGGHISAGLDRGDFGNSEAFEFSGALSSRFNDNSDGSSSALRSTLANQNHRFSLLTSHDEGNETRIGNDDEIGGSQYRRSRHDLSYAWRSDLSTIEVYAGELDTRNTGTPALPMDINYIDSDLVGTNFTTMVGEVTLTGHVSYNHLAHLMDNFSQREGPAPDQYRANKVSAHNTAWSLAARWPLQRGFLTLGADGNQTIHSGAITNPNNDLFELSNFSDTERDTYGVFSEWAGNLNQWQVEAGLRYNQVRMDSDTVSANGMMGMMAAHVATLAEAFNTADLEKSYHNLDATLHLSRPLTNHTRLNLGLGRKNRAPSYQERYLWLPLNATGGLADGRNYIGNLAIDSETAYEVTAGIDWQSGMVWASPQLFYRRINDYIQGVPTSNAVANMVSSMMSGKAALMFDNVDAKMYGMDTGYGYRISDQLKLEGNLSYVRGKRRDEDDNLYRVAPLNNRLALIYENAQLTLAGESVLYAPQNLVSGFNEEKKTPGYGILNLSGSYRVTKQLSISGGIENLFDHRYDDHLSAYNRNGDSDITPGERLPGAGRNIYLAATLHW